jgi:predicted metal-dependent TIM-barrel fold hydrolase
MDGSVDLPPIVAHPRVNKVKTIGEILDIAASGSDKVNRALYSL